MLDLLLTNARIVDGTGNPWRKGCVGVRDGRIVAVGSAHDMPEARTVLDIGGNILCPGFIDSHSHSDLRIIDEPLALPKIMQGITTENVGLDSMSVAPISDKNKEPWSTSISGLDGVAQKPWGWNGFASYLNALDAAKPSVNLSSYVGLGTVRLDVMGMEDRPPTAEELRLMEESVARCMEEGARGISAGLIYTPNKYQSTEELVALAKVAARYDGILDVHMRNEADHMAEALEEVIHIGRETGIRILVTHFKLRGRRNWGTPAGISTPSTGPAGKASTSASPVSVYGQQHVHARRRSAVVPQPGDGRPAQSLGGGTRTGQKGHARHRRLGKFLAGHGLGEHLRLLGRQRKEPLVRRQKRRGPWRGPRQVARGRGAGSADRGKPCRGPAWARHVRRGCDGRHEAPDHVSDHRRPAERRQAASAHLCGLPRFIARYVREKRLLTLEEAVRKMTSSTALKLRMKRKGFIMPGMDADMVVFGEDRIRDVNTFENPRVYPEGIDYVLVNGEIAVDHGVHTGARPGKTIRD